MIPDDLLQGPIQGFVQDLMFLDHKKEVLMTLASEAKEEFKDRFIYEVECRIEEVEGAREYLLTGLDEAEHGPSGWCGQYECRNLNHARELYKSEVEFWNNFVDCYIDIAADLLGGTRYIRAFKHKIYTECG